MLNTNRLYILRAARRISQTELAHRLKIGRYRYWQIENGYVVPTAQERAALAKFFGVSDADVFQEPTSSESGEAAAS